MEVVTKDGEEYILDDELTLAETMFIDLLDDEKLFNRKKFEKALRQEKMNKITALKKEVHGGNNNKNSKQDRRSRSAAKTKTVNMIKGSSHAGIHDKKAAESSVLPQADAAAKAQVIIKKPKDESKKRTKQPGMIDIYGEQRVGPKEIEGYSFFNDLNYGDMVLAFSNPFYDFQLKERQEIDMFQLTHIEQLKDKNMGKVQMSATETKKKEKRIADMTTILNERYKTLAETKSLENMRIDLKAAYSFFLKNLNIKPETQMDNL